MQSLKMADYIGSEILVTVTKARMLVGTLVATDSELNLLLDNVEEISANRSRKLGLISVPQTTIESIQIKATQLETIKKSKFAWSEDII
ncbi:LAME_0E11760g1_1 [Lachancea meyersii CBS 8951]|uniref:LAME_0E11760g1_1 n=1 Tax=Lachancea meyersii CBS 8951 TaxID=1266667 RepID=A0A1G4JKX9_9SACH|nr:LAME_0E11760g1_1 [Lachancea meyersii CBS 8951]